MVFRAFLLGALAALVFAEADFARADGLHKLMPKEASVVVPLLKKIKPGDSLSKVQNILGDGLSPTIDGAGQVLWYCMLDNGSVVRVEDTHHNVASIVVIDAEGNVLYSNSQAAK
jgi:hypothetical protein